MFHVKHVPPEHSDVVVNDSFTNTKIAKDDVQNILDIDSASESAERRRSRAQFLGDQLLIGSHDPAANARSSAATVSSNAWRWRARVMTADSVDAK